MLFHLPTQLGSGIEENNILILQGAKTDGTDLQLREQFRIFTEFPFNLAGHLPARTKIPYESNDSV